MTRDIDEERARKARDQARSRKARKGKTVRVEVRVPPGREPDIRKAAAAMRESGEPLSTHATPDAAVSPIRSIKMVTTQSIALASLYDLDSAAGRLAYAAQLRGLVDQGFSRYVHAVQARQSGCTFGVDITRIPERRREIRSMIAQIRKLERGSKGE